MNMNDRYQPHRIERKYLIVNFVFWLADVFRWFAKLKYVVADWRIRRDLSRSVLIVLLLSGVSWAFDPTPATFSIILSDPSTGANSLLVLKNSEWVKVPLPSVRPNTWNIVGAVKNKIIWCNKTTREIVYWNYDGQTGQLITGYKIGVVPPGAHITCTGE